jgi:hypothetical protein
MKRKQSIDRKQDTDTDTNTDTEVDTKRHVAKKLKTKSDDDTNRNKKETTPTSLNLDLSIVVKQNTNTMQKHYSGPLTLKCHLLRIVEAYQENVSWAASYLLEKYLLPGLGDQDEHPSNRIIRDSNLLNDVKTVCQSKFGIEADRWAEFAKLPFHPVVSGSTIAAIARNKELWAESDLDIFVAQYAIPTPIDLSCVDLDELQTRLKLTIAHIEKERSNMIKEILKALGLTFVMVKFHSSPRPKYLEKRTGLQYFEQNLGASYRGEVEGKGVGRLEMNITFPLISKEDNCGSIEQWIEEHFDTKFTAPTFDGLTLHIPFREELASFTCDYRFRPIVLETQDFSTVSFVDRINHHLQRIKKYVRRGARFTNINGTNTFLVSVLLHAIANPNMETKLKTIESISENKGAHTLCRTT